MTRAELARRLTPLLSRWIAAACLWDDTGAIGDRRFLVFSIDPAPEVQVYVQFWSEPGEPVLWEVSSGRWNPPADQWLAGERSRRIEALGFVIGGEAENYQRHVDIRSRAHARRLARAVVDVLVDGFV